MHAFSAESRLYKSISMSVLGVGSRTNSLLNIVGKWSDKFVFTMTLLKSLFKMHLVTMLSMTLAVCLVTLVGLFIVGIILTFWIFLSVSKSRRLILISPARKKAFFNFSNLVIQYPFFLINLDAAESFNNFFYFSGSSF